MAKHTSPGAHAAHSLREQAAEALSDATIRDELTRQATQASAPRKSASIPAHAQQKAPLSSHTVAAFMFDFLFSPSPFPSLLLVHVRRRARET